MKKYPEKIHGVNVEIVNLIQQGKPMTFIIEKKNRLYERIFTPTGSMMDRSIISYRHKKNSYEILNIPDGKVHKLIDRKDMPDTSTIDNHIYRTIQILVDSGYRYVSSAQIGVN